MVYVFLFLNFLICYIVNSFKQSISWKLMSLSLESASTHSSWRQIFLCLWKFKVDIIWFLSLFFGCCFHFLFCFSFHFLFLLQMGRRKWTLTGSSSSVFIASECFSVNILNINSFLSFHFDFFFNDHFLKVVPLCICKQAGNGLEYTIPWRKKPGLAVMLLIWTCRGFRSIHRSAPVITIPQVALEETFA